MNFKAKVILPVMTLAAAAILAACGGNEASPAPASLPTNTPPAAPTATSTLTTPTLESNLLGTVECDKQNQEGVNYITSGNLVSWINIGAGIDDYASRVTGGRAKIPSDDFQCVYAFVDQNYRQIIAFGQTKSGLFPSKVSVINPEGKSEVQRFFHPGHIKGVVPLYGVNTPKGVKDVLVVAALSNIGELTGSEPYVPAVFLVDRSNMEVLAYEVVSQSGQALELRTESVNGVPTVSFRIDRDSPGVRRATPLENLFNPDAMARAQKYQSLFR
ncbi:hypothetical protein HYV85_02405 [Candidatus Woesearchaeota archaeon]|nr:hypothetical protein [Candidatus Woesearchaeota archaeon]